MTTATANKVPQPLLISALLILATLAMYWRVQSFEFLNYDDPIYAAGNPHVLQGINGTSLLWGWTNIEAEFWQPLTWWSHMLDCQLYGARPGGHHVTNLLLHLANTLLLFFALRVMTGACWRSGFVAALFALHPLHVESVAWISERKDVLSTFFALLSLLAYGYYALASRTTPLDADPEESERPAPPNTSSPARFYMLALLAFALSLMAKPTLVTFPFVLLLLDYWPLKRLVIGPETALLKAGLGLLREKIPFFALTVASAASSYWIQASRHNLGGLAQFPLSLRLANAVMSYFLYVRKMFWPADLAAFYPYPDEWPPASVVAAGMILILITLLAILFFRRLPYFAVGWFWFLGTLVPMIGLVQVSHHAMADRYTYVPMIGCFIVVVWGIAGAAEKLTADTRLVAAAGAVCVLCVGWVGARQVSYWRDSETLFRHAIEVTKNNYVAHDNLGAALELQGRHDEALANFEEAFRIECALKSNPDLSAIRFDLGTALFQQGKLDEAKVHLIRAVEIQPNLPRSHHNLACVLASQGRFDEAIPQYQEALRLDPQFSEARTCLELVQTQRQQEQAAAAHLESGAKLLDQRRAGDALKEYREALRLRPEWPEALNTTAWLLASDPNPAVRNGTEAVTFAEHACALTGSTNLAMISTLAAAYAEAGRFADAVKAQTKACELALSQPQTNSTDSCTQRLELYRSQRAYHQP